MSKRFKGKTCTYCARPETSDTADHVFARQFFPEQQRANLPQVPACDACNQQKSQLEHYLTTVLPFGAQHADGRVVLDNDVPKRLAKNAKLHRALETSQRAVNYVSGGKLQPGLSIEFDSLKLFGLTRYLTRGLMFHHFGRVVPPERYVSAGMLIAGADGILQELLEMQGAARVKQGVGKGAFEYEGVQGLEDPFFSVWKFEFYGGLMLADDPFYQGEIPSHVWSVVGREPMPGLFHE